MLKIIDNYDLKQLEKCGFNYYQNGKYKVYEIDEWESYIGIELKDRIIRIGIEDYHELREDVLYDMIKDGIVEKVEE